jgi:solute:Na+ symporter, SSS family
MSIGAANLFTRNVWKSSVNPAIGHAGYVGLGALIFNIAVAAVATAVIGLISPNPRGATARP